VSILEEILAAKREEVARLRRERLGAELEARAREAGAPRSFAAALRSGPAPRIVAEIKRASPSRGLIRGDADPAGIARSYARGGAAALSVLTDGPYFRGSLEDLRAVRGAVELAVLRKDFVIDPLQVLEARAAGSDGVLLIVAALDDGALRELLACAKATAMDPLVEVHTREELERALEAGAEILGINNRDLRTFRTDVEVTRALLPYTDGRTVVSESGIENAATLRSLARAGVHAFLIGESLMRAPDPGEALGRLREEACRT
jgi:indole-3-glycerol phosphate synthase